MCDWPNGLGGLAVRLLLANGVKMKAIQEWLGHRDFSTTANIYAHLDYSEKIESANVMGSILEIKNNQGENLERIQA